MRDKPPLLVERRLGALVAKNTPAADAIKALDGVVEIRIVKGSANLRRLGFYWVAAGVAAAHLGEAVDGGLDAETLHRLTKRKLGVGREITLPSGEIVLDVDSIGVAAMSEPDRTRYIDRALGLWSRWLKVPIEDLMNEARRNAA